MKKAKPARWDSAFESRRNDRLLARGISGELNTDESAELLDKISSDSRFRENFCDWVRAFRDPGTANAPRKQGKAS